MADGTLTEGVHFTRPRGLRPRFNRGALVEWLEGREAGEPVAVQSARRSRSRLNLALLQPGRGGRGL